MTERVPKPLLPLGDRTVLAELIRHLAGDGFRRIHLTVHYRADAIREHCGDGSRWGVSVEYLEEETPLGTAGSLGLLRDVLDEPALVLNGDLLTTVRPGDLLDQHRRQGAGLTVGVRRHDVQVPYGVIDALGDRIRGFSEKPTYSFQTSAGIYAVSPSLLRLVPRGRPCDMDELIDAALRQGEDVRLFPLRGYWLDIGGRPQYRQAREDVRSGRVGSSVR